MNEADILNALQTALLASVAASPLPAIGLKMLGRNYEIPANAPWIEEVWIPNNVTGITWGSEQFYRGIYRVLLHYPRIDTGFIPALTILKPVVDYFAKGRKFVSGAMTVEIYENPELVSAVETGAETLFVVSIWYSSFQP